MTDCFKQDQLWRDGEGHFVQAGAADVGRPEISSGSDGVLGRKSNWAWASDNAHYDWMDHAPLFGDCD